MRRDGASMMEVWALQYSYICYIGKHGDLETG